MEKTVSNNIEIFEEKNIKNTSLYIKNIRLNAESYEAKILTEENIENVIKYQIVYEGENRLLKYDVSNTISFEEYLKTNKLRKKDVCDILLAIDDILFSIENYLISENSILLDLKAIRIVKKRNGIRYRFITIPNLNYDFSYELSKFLIRILRFVDVEDKDALSLAYSLFVKSSKDNYTMNDLMEIVDKVRDKNSHIDYDVALEDLINYDEEMAKEISEEVMEENKFDFTGIDADNVNKEMEIENKKHKDSAVDENSIEIDDETNDILEESLFNDFNKDDKKIIKFKKNIFGIKKKKALKGHINIGLIGLSLAPIILILLPTLYFILNM
ncbi:MAG: hypothetical protein J6M39_02790 [Lachnospiraceae bacterium]|nr:hypothetical protein [Lachnospiraceae bacterium]